METFFFQKIILPSRPQADTIVGIFLLKSFGEEKYPGIKTAQIEIWSILPEKQTEESLNKKGYFLIDIGAGKFDHHFKKTNVSQLIAEDLEISDDITLQKLLLYAGRDDKYGLGTISSDSIDKAFGLSGLIMALNRALPENPQKVIEIVLPLIKAHYLEEEKRINKLPKEFEEKKEKGEVEIFTVKQGKKQLKVVILESSNPSMPGWLKSQAGLKADVIVQKAASGHVNILTRPLKKVDLRWSTAYLRNQEAVLRNQKIKLYTSDLIKPGRLNEIPQWYYDRATNSILNGGVNPRGISPTIVPLKKIEEMIKKGLSQSLIKNNG